MALSTHTTLTNAYKATDLGDIKPTIVIGGNTKMFVPNVNISYKLGSFKEDFYININRKSVTVDKEAQIFTEDTIKLAIGNETDIWHVDEKGNLKWDIEFKEKPSTNVFTWELLYSTGISFAYQEALTEKEIADGYIRPDNVVGSYAVYCNKKNNAYRTGKLLHIYRPLCIDANGGKEWADLTIEKNVLSITIPQKYLDDATYPITLDPTLGYTSAGASSWGSGAYIRANIATTDASGGAIQSFHVAVNAVDSSESNRKFKMGVYATSGGDPGGQSLLEQAEITGVTVSDDNSISAVGTTLLVASTAYCIAIAFFDSDNTVKYDNSVGISEYALGGANYSSEMANPASDNLNYNADRAWSIWIVYAAGGGFVLPIGYYNFNNVRP